jgi:L-rhamnose-H+ transport protein
LTTWLQPGFFLVLLAGICQGSFMVPTKAMRGWAWENYWLIFSVTAYLISPWILAFTTVPGLLEVYAGTGLSTFAIVSAFGVAWGIGALTFGKGVEALGLALGFAIILGVTSLVGTIIPLVFAPSASLSHRQMALIAGSLLLMLAGVLVCSLAGRWKESESGGRKLYGRGVLICIASGVLSSCGNLKLVFGQKITARAELLGVPAALAPNAVWVFLTLPAFLCNVGYSVFLLRRNGSAGLYFGRNLLRQFLLAVAMGVLWMAGFEFYSMGARRLGELGHSLGWAILMSTIVLVANGLGIATGEWKNAPSKSFRQLAAGVSILICAVAGLVLAN